MSKPLVSIITTCYNYARYVGELAESIAKQDFSYEWIVVDDASQDDPLKVLQPFAQETKLHYIRLPKNCGYSVAKNVGLREAQGDYFCMIDADDQLMANSLAVRYDCLRTHPDKLWVHAEAWDITPGGHIAKPYPKNNQDRFKKFAAQGKDFNIWYTHRLIHAQTVMVRRAFHEKLGLYDEALRFSSDNEMWRRAIRFGVLPIYLPQPVSIYRVHDARMSRSAYKKAHITQAKVYIIDVVEKRFREGITKENTPLLEVV